MQPASAVIASLVLLSCAACASSKLSTLPVTSKPSHPVKVIALAPDGGLLADAVGVELANRGFRLIDSTSSSKILIRLNLNEVEIARPEGLARLREQGIDAWLSVRAAGGYDQQPQSASARMVSTHSGEVLAGVTWQNGWGGMAGSIADRTMRKGLSEAAAEISTALAERLR